MQGRDQEWQTVADLLQRGRRGSGGGILLVEGKPGMGKTLLLSEAARAGGNGGFVVVAAAADELTRFIPAGPLLAALRDSASARSQQAGRRKADESPLVLVESLRQRLESSARTGPVLVCLDDLQWADPATLLALRLLPSALASYPMAWILARSRPDHGSHAEVLFDVLASQGATRIALAPLGDDAVAGLIADATGGKPDQALLALASAAAGNPFLITELIAGLIDENSVTVKEPPPAPGAGG